MRTHVSLESWYEQFLSLICYHSLLSSMAPLTCRLTKTSIGINSCRRWCLKTNCAYRFNRFIQHVQICGLRVLTLSSHMSLLNMLLSAWLKAWVFSVVGLTGISTAEEPGMVGSGRVPGMEAGRGCLCLFRRCSSEDREPGTGLRSKTHNDFQRRSYPKTRSLRLTQKLKLIGHTRSLG